MQLFIKDLGVYLISSNMFLYLNIKLLINKNISILLYIIRNYIEVKALKI